MFQRTRLDRNPARSKMPKIKGLAGPRWRSALYKPKPEIKLKAESAAKILILVTVTTKVEYKTKD